MPLKLIKARTLPIGVDVGTTAVKMAQMRLADGETELLAAARLTVPRRDPRKTEAYLTAVAETIRGQLKHHAFVGRKAVLSLPADVTFVHHVKTPRLSDGELDQALQFELQGKLPYAPQDAVIRAIVAGDVLGEGDARQEVIVVAASRQVVESYLRMAHRATLDVVALNVEPCALAECFGRLFRRADDASRTILFIDIGASTTQVVLTHGSRLVFARNLLKGGDRLDEAVAKSLNITPDQARELRRRYSADDCPDPAAGEELYRLLGRPLQEMADELAQCLNYYESVFRGRSVERAIFVGGSAHDKRLCQSLAQRLNLPAQVGDPLMRVRRLDRNCVAADEKVPQPDWAVAVGLSLGAAGL